MANLFALDNPRRKNLDHVDSVVLKLQFDTIFIQFGPKLSELGCFKRRKKKSQNQKIKIQTRQNSEQIYVCGEFEAVCECLVNDGCVRMAVVAYSSYCILVDHLLICMLTQINLTFVSLLMHRLSRFKKDELFRLIGLNYAVKFCALSGHMPVDGDLWNIPLRRPCLSSGLFRPLAPKIDTVTGAEL
ncbi:hypothetical protein BpHYR1_001313 [Brachionus plicatilis]|uniref:Uncharacterized protein n=1 Tax=Brachionus plicatilis TaxID=10195 RepID=A0A3M7T7V7_BRAPC|nr:hypothetical protein BpHYR1_001313 [Brachionus plicatilis]